MFKFKQKNTIKLQTSYRRTKYKMHRLNIQYSHIFYATISILLQTSSKSSETVQWNTDDEWNNNFKYHTPTKHTTQSHPHHPQNHQQQQVRVKERDRIETENRLARAQASLPLRRTMSLEMRNNTAMSKRAEQLRRWEESDTAREPSYPKNEAGRRIKFSSGCVFLAACASGERDDVLQQLQQGADIDTANTDGLTALHQVCSVHRYCRIVCHDIIIM